MVIRAGEAINEIGGQMAPNEYAPSLCGQTFWMVYVEGAGTPIVKHWQRTSAYKEAERLARKTHKPAIVLQAVRICEVAQPTPPIQWTDLYA